MCEEVSQLDGANVSVHVTEEDTLKDVEPTLMTKPLLPSFLTWYKS